ncbi:MAG: hypothetical protein QF615_07590, partial [Planctomycetota bacterium]|nr:hypothetical protein [Planctomycetota bacterium]
AVEVATDGPIRRAENLALVRTLELKLLEYDEVNPTDYCGALLVDTQPEFGHTELPAGISLLALFDHHLPPDGASVQTPGPGVSGAELSGQAAHGVPHRDVRTGLGSAAAIVWSYLREAQAVLDAATASALFCGVRFDTADLSRNASPLDEEAYYATFSFADREAIARIQHPPLPPVYYAELHRALALARQHGSLVLALLGPVANPESIAETADFLLRMRGCSWVVVGGAFEQEYVLSLRTDFAFGRAWPLMERVLGGLGTFGGHGQVAGARILLPKGAGPTPARLEETLRTNALAVMAEPDPSQLATSSVPLGRPIV